MEFDAEFWNGLAGLAALVNSLLMWPTIKALKGHGPRIDTLEKDVQELKDQPKFIPAKPRWGGRL